MRGRGWIGVVVGVASWALLVPPADAVDRAGVPTGTGGVVASFGVKGLVQVPTVAKSRGQAFDAVLPGPGGRFRVVNTGRWITKYPNEYDGFIQVTGYLANGKLDPGYNKGKPVVIDTLHAFEGSGRTFLGSGTDAAGRVYLMTHYGDSGVVSYPEVQRLRPDGSVDKAYHVSVDEGTSPQVLVVRPDGSLRLSYGALHDELWYVAAFTPSGAPDQAFGTGQAPGVAQYEPSSVFRPDGNRLDLPADVDAAGNLYVAGWSSPDPNAAAIPAVLKLGPDGKPVAGWGSAGVVAVSAAGWELARLDAVRVTPTGTVLAGGAARSAAGVRPYVVRITAAGSLDSGFGAAGVRTFALLGRATQRIAWGAAGRAYLSFGPDLYKDAGKHAASVLRIDAANGAVDTSWAAGGSVLLPKTDRVPQALPRGSTRVLIASGTDVVGGKGRCYVQSRTA